jgi:hypothetical protein
MSKRNIALSLAVAPAVAVLIASCAPSTHKNNLTMQCTETRTAAQNASLTGVADGGVAGTGRCTITGVLHDSGPVTDYRTQNGEKAIIRRVVNGAKGTITFMIRIDMVSGGEPWTITSGTKTYAKLHGRGNEVVDNYAGSPATFVLKGTVSSSPSSN